MKNQWKYIRYCSYTIPLWHIKMNDQFQILSTFKGFGKPNGKIWFIGIEESVDFKADFEQIIQNYSKEYLLIEKGSILKDSKIFGNSYTKVYDIMAKIMVGLFPITDWRTYRNSTLLTKDGNEFQMNLYPLGKKKLSSWTDFYQKQFGFINKQQYLTKVQADRFQELYKYWIQNSPDFTICFGIGNLIDFKETFRLTDETQLNDSNSVLFPKEKVIVTPFFDNRNMGQNRIDITVNTIQNILTKSLTNENN